MITAVATQIKEHPILFSGAMVRAILDGSKTQTRRVIKKIDPDCDGLKFGGKYWQMQWNKSSNENGGLLEIVDIKCPYGKVGDRFWVRETWKEGTSDSHKCWGYRADMKYQCGKDIPDDGLQKWKPSIFMPRSHCRIKLDITNIRAERLNDISEGDAIAEGIHRTTGEYWSGGLHKIKGTTKHLPSPQAGYQDLWDSINGKTIPWASNPWVWVVEFKRVEL